MILFIPKLDIKMKSTVYILLTCVLLFMISCKPKKKIIPAPKYSGYTIKKPTRWAF